MQLHCLKLEDGSRHMKIKSGFTVRKIAKSYLAVPIGKRTKDVRGVIALNETGAFLWELMKQDTTVDVLAEKLGLEYELPIERARIDIRAFVDNLREQGWLDETAD